MSTTATAPARALDDRLNPILVKEVRQALRGKYFVVMFWLTLLVATFAGLMVVASASADAHLEQVGQPYFLVMFGCLAAAAHGFVPFWAFLTTGAEWDENTHDLLVLSDLRPRQIVLGKLCSALVQAGLYYSSFGPFLVFAFLLNGIDLLSIGVLLAGSLATCVALTLVGIALASLARNRAARGVLMAVFGVALVAAWSGAIGMASEIVDSPHVLRDPMASSAGVFFVSSALLIGLVFGLIAAARFSHEEENRSTGLRVVSLAVVLIASGWGAWLSVRGGSNEPLTVMPAFAAVALYVLWTFFLTERDTLGRRAAKLVPRTRWRALLAAPFLPGGGLAVLLFLLQAGCALLGALISLAFFPLATGLASQTLAQIVVIYGYAFAYAALPAGLASLSVRSPRGRAIARVVILGLVPVGMLGPALLGLLLGIQSWMELRHPFNPAWLLEELDGSRRSSEVLVNGSVLLGLAVFLALALNLPRARAGVQEVLAASRARRRAAPGP